MKRTQRDSNQDNSYRHVDERNTQCPKGRQNQGIQENANSNKAQKKTFLAKLRAAALQQSKLHMEKQQNGSFILKNEEETLKSPTIEVITLTSDSTQNSPIKVYASDNKYDFMVTFPNSPIIPTNFTSTLSTPKIDKAVKKIQELNTTRMTSNSPIENRAIPFRITHTELTAPNSIKSSESSTDNVKTTNHKAETNRKQIMEEEPKGSLEHDPNDEDFAALTCPGKNSISDTKPGDFYDEELQELSSSWRVWYPSPDGTLTKKDFRSTKYKHC